MPRCEDDAIEDPAIETRVPNVCIEVKLHQELGNRSCSFQSKFTYALSIVEAGGPHSRERQRLTSCVPSLVDVTPGHNQEVNSPRLSQDSKELNRFLEEIRNQRSKIARR